MKFELAKIRKRTSVTAAILGILLYIILMTAGSVRGECRYDSSGNEITGFSAISLAREQTGNWEGALTTDKLAAVIRYSRQVYADPANISKEFNDVTTTAYGKYVQKDSELQSLLIAAFSPIGTYDYTVWRTLKPEDAELFYQKHAEKTEEILNTDNSYHFSEAEKRFFLTRSEEIETPFYFAYTDGWIKLLRGISSVSLVIALAICVCIAPVFASEYQTGAVSILLSSKHGKGKAITAKIIASFIFATAVYSIATLLYTIAMLGCYGTEGWNASLQMYLFTAPHAFTLLETYLLGIGLNYLVLLAVLSITLALSSGMKTPFPVVVSSTLILFVPLFLPNGSSSHLWNLTMALFPAKAMDISTVCGVYNVYHFAGKMLTTPAAICIVFIILVVLPLPFARMGFQKHQVI